MDRKIQYRISSIVVILAMVIGLFFIIHKYDKVLIKEAKLVESPPFTAKILQIVHYFSQSQPPSVSLINIEQNELNIKNAVWVIQMGSFKNKANAIRLLNHLRANGYRAFMQQASTRFGNIRILVGPESQKTVAYALADRLNSNLHIRGIVMPYQPLIL